MFLRASGVRGRFQVRGKDVQGGQDAPGSVEQPRPSGIIQSEPEVHLKLHCPVPSHTGVALHKEFL